MENLLQVLINTVTNIGEVLYLKKLGVKVKAGNDAWPVVHPCEKKVPEWFILNHSGTIS
jgi:hypothetical protein